MIVDTMSVEEKQLIISKYYKQLLIKAGSLAKPYYKTLCKMSRTNHEPIIFNTMKTIVFNNNNYIIGFGTSTGSLKDFGIYIFLVIPDKQGYKKYYQIFNGGLLREYTNHCIERFIERSPYECNKQNFLPFLIKECSVFTSAEFSDEIQFLNTLNGIIVYKSGIAITYITDLSQYKENERSKVEVLTKELGYSRKDAYRSTLEGVTFLYEKQ